MQDMLLWKRQYSLEKDVKLATKRFKKRLKEIPNTIIFNDQEMIEYKGDLDVQFSKYVHKNHFKLACT